MKIGWGYEIIADAIQKAERANEKRHIKMLEGAGSDLSAAIPTLAHNEGSNLDLRALNREAEAIWDYRKIIRILQANDFDALNEMVEALIEMAKKYGGVAQ